MTALRTLPRLRAAVLNCIVVAGDRGRTCYEVEQALWIKHQTCSARFAELKRAGLISATGQRRRTDGGTAKVWVVR